MSGLRINLSKCVVVGVNMDDDKVHRYAREVRCVVGE